MNGSLSDLTIREIELFVMAAKLQSIREVSRQSGLLPGHVSKIMKRLETKMRQTLFRRSASGITLTPDGLNLLDIAIKVAELSQGLVPQEAGASLEKLWTIGSISFITTYLIAPKIADLKKSGRNVRFRLIEFTHNDLVAHGLKGAFEIAIHIEELQWTSVWESYSLGKINWKLYGRSGHPLGEQSTEREVAQYPFIVPTDWSPGGYSIGEDFCPLSTKQRKKGDEAATAETALEICRHSDQLTFVPEILTKGWTDKKGLAEIHIESWPKIEKEIFLSVRSDSVSRKLVEAIRRQLQS